MPSYPCLTEKETEEESLPDTMPPGRGTGSPHFNPALCCLSLQSCLCHHWLSFIKPLLVCPSPVTVPSPRVLTRLERSRVPLAPEFRRWKRLVGGSPCPLRTPQSSHSPRPASSR